MNAREIKRLRRKFIAISMASIFVTMLFIGATVNLFSYLISRVSIDNTLDRLIEDAETVETVEADEQSYQFSFSDVFAPKYGRNAFFILRFSEDGTLLKLYSNAQNSDEAEQVKRYAAVLFDRTSTTGQYYGYYYKRAATDHNETILAFLEGTQIVSNALRTGVLTILVCFFGLVFTFFLVRRFSARAIRPEIENAERQKHFITNASHELKTPLAVIRANTEMQELTQGESEWTASTLKQVDHMDGLIKNLVMITRAQEQEDKENLAAVDVSKTVKETIDPFESLAAQKQLTILRKIRDNVSLVADESKIRQLVTILIDNALKYCDENGEIEVSLAPLKNGKGMQLVFANDYAAGENVDCERFFDRFYREDQSHNIDQGGYGIGLSIAESICKQYNGSIRAEWQDGVIRFICQMK